MSSLSKVGRFAAARKNDRSSLCSFTFSDGRRCRTPRAGNHPHFCFDHARKESQARSAETLAQDLAYFFSGDYLSANDLSSALGRLIPAVLHGDVKPRTARTLAYLAQTLLQTIRLAQHEYINAFSTDAWRSSIRNSVNSNHDHLFPPANPPVVAGLQTGASAPQLALAPSVAYPAPVPHPACHSERSEDLLASERIARGESAFPNSPAPSPIIASAVPPPPARRPACPGPVGERSEGSHPIPATPFAPSPPAIHNTPSPRACHSERCEDLLASGRIARGESALPKSPAPSQTAASPQPAANPL